jgi:hypothetical protein
MDPKELDNTTMPEVNDQVTPEIVVEKISEVIDFNYDLFGCWEDEWDNNQGDVILFI